MVLVFGVQGALAAFKATEERESEATSQVGLIVLSCQLFAILGVAWTVAKLLVLQGLGCGV